MATQVRHDDNLERLDVSRMEMCRDDAWRSPFQPLLAEIAPSDDPSQDTMISSITRTSLLS